MSDWTPSSWNNKTAAQQPRYNDRGLLDAVVSELSERPPLVTSWEVERLKSQLALAAGGKAFLLQGGDCAERFVDCTGESIEKKLKIMLQM